MSTPIVTQNKKAFTLLETAITMGVAALVLGAIWGAAGHARESANIRTASDDLMAITQNVAALYSSMKSMPITPADATANLVASNTFPQAVIDKNNIPRHVWGGLIRITTSPTSTNLFRVEMTDMPASTCTKLVGSLANATGLAAVRSASTWIVLNRSYYNNVIPGGYGQPTDYNAGAFTCTASGTLANAAFEFSIWPAN